MNKNMKKLIPVLCTLLMCSCHISIDIGNSDDEDFNKGNATYDSIPEDIYIDWKSGSVSIEYFDQSYVEIYETSNTDLLSSQEVRHYMSGSKLKINFCKSNISSEKIQGLNKDLVIYLPRDTQLFCIDYEAGSSNFYANQIKCQEYDIKTGSGNSYINTLGTTKYIEMHCGSGNLVVTGDRVNKFSFESASGECEIATVTPPSEGNIEVASGNVYFYFPEDIEGFHINYTSASGEFRSNYFPTSNRKKDYYYGTNPEAHYFDISAASGNVIVKTFSDF